MSPLPFLLRLKARAVALICRAALAFASEREREEGLRALIQNYELLARWSERAQMGEERE